MPSFSDPTFDANPNDGLAPHRVTRAYPENLDYKHLMNVSRIGKVITQKPVPTDAEI
jgi:hypothetical protein